MPQSPAVQDIIGYVPHWLVRGGISVIFFVLLVLLIGSWFFRYLDVVSGSIVVSTNPPPIAVMATQTGKITRVLVDNHQTISTGQSLMVFDNLAAYRDVLAMKTLLESIKEQVLKNSAIPTILSPTLPPTLPPLGQWHLGELQSPYAAWHRATSEHQFFLQDDAQNSIVLDTGHQQQKRQLELDASQTYAQLMNRIQAWEYQYILKSPVAGKVIFTKPYRVHQTVGVGERVLLAVPEGQGEYQGNLRLPLTKANQVKQGQLVMIRLFNNDQEGQDIRGSVAQISSIPAQDQSILVEVA